MSSTGNTPSPALVGGFSNKVNKKMKDLYLHYGHLRLFHSHEDLARFLAYGGKYDQILVNNDQTE